MDVTTLIKLGGGVNAFAQRLGVSHPTICDWRRDGRIPPGRMFQVCHVLGLQVEDIQHLVRQTPKKEEAA
jgi:hypothetical protein